MDKQCLTFILMKDHPKTPAAPIRERQGAKIRQFREFRGLTQEALAEPLGVSKAAVSDWERGVSTPRQHLQVAIARELGTPWSALFGLDAEAVA